MNNHLILVVSPSAQLFDGWARSKLQELRPLDKYSYNRTQGRLDLGNICFLRILATFPDSMRGLMPDEVIYLAAHLIPNFDEVKQIADSRLIWKTTSTKN